MVCGFPLWLSSKEPTCSAGDAGVIPEWGRFPWSRARQPSPVFQPGKSQKQRSLAHYSPWGCKEADTAEVTEHTQTHAYTVDQQSGPGHRSGRPRERQLTQAMAAGANSKQLTRLVSTPAPWSLQVHPEASAGPGLDSATRPVSDLYPTSLSKAASLNVVLWVGPEARTRFQGTGEG